MAFLRWNADKSSMSDEERDVQSLLAELEGSTYLADKRAASKELVVAVRYMYEV